MFTFSVCCICAVFGATLAEYYLPVEEHPYYTYQSEYAPQYDNYEPKDYHFQYAVSDPHTGDHKSQWEVKEKGVVRGSYSLLEPDGTTRVVEYVADDHGFRAVVKKLGTAIHPHHHKEALVRLPEAYSSGYSGAYSGLGENYGVGTSAVPIETYSTESVAAPVENYNIGSVPIPVENYDTGSVPIPVESYDTGNVAIPVENYITGGLAIPVEHHNTGSVPIPIQVANHGASVEIHGFTGNADDDSSYTNYDHGNTHENNANVYYHTNGGHQNYYVQPKPVPVPYGRMSYNGPTYWG